MSVAGMRYRLRSPPTYPGEPIVTDYEYALRTVAVASGQAFEIAHAVAPETLVALCGTVAIPEPASRWSDSDPGARCEACERSIRSLNEPEPEPEPAVMPEPIPASVRPQLQPEPEPVRRVVSNAARPRTGDIALNWLDRTLSGWHGMSRGVQFGFVGALLSVVLAVVVVLTTMGGFKPDRNIPSYKNGYAYGHDLMSQSNDVTSACTQATVDEPTTADGKNFIAGCEAGYAARTP